jgi:hypothetical protein
MKLNRLGMKPNPSSMKKPSKGMKNQTKLMK